MPGPPFRSKLEPFLDFITQERRKRLTWKQIAQAIKDQGTPCTPQGVQDYFKRRRKKMRVPLGFEPQASQRSQPDEPETKQNKLSDEYKQKLEDSRGGSGKLFNEKHFN